MNCNNLGFVISCGRSTVYMYYCDACGVSAFKLCDSEHDNCLIWYHLLFVHSINDVYILFIFRTIFLSFFPSTASSSSSNLCRIFLLDYFVSINHIFIYTRFLLYFNLIWTLYLFDKLRNVLYISDALVESIFN